MSIAFVPLKLEGGQIDPLPGVTGSRNSPGGIGLKPCGLNILKQLNKSKGWAKTRCAKLMKSIDRIHIILPCSSCSVWSTLGPVPTEIVAPL